MVADTVMEEDKRGKHKNHQKVNESIKESIREHIRSIPKIDSHYTRANTSKHYIDGSKSITEIYRDYVANCKTNKQQFSNYTLFYRIFTEEFNISVFQPKKDLCDLCTAFGNAEGEEDKERLKIIYDQHLMEKELSRAEKNQDKLKSNTIVAVYDLQAVFQCPKGDVSIFYYHSKLNVLNFTIYNLLDHTTDCYVWDESCGNRGINELGTCVYKFLEKINENGNEVDVIFYSDNCPGQQKNKFMIALYLFAVQQLENIATITHKFLIKGHTQNEGDSVPSLIERQVKKQLKSGPMYTPESFITAIRSKKSFHSYFLTIPLFSSITSTSLEHLNHWLHLNHLKKFITYFTVLICHIAHIKMFTIHPIKQIQYIS